ncbi:MAG: leucine-rich repeat domain-containing protein [Bacteroidales bacterium]|nr:leucine-rich repeat domain-containing protein [Bacteroidales bacterium]
MKKILLLLAALISTTLCVAQSEDIEVNDIMYTVDFGTHTAYAWGRGGCVDGTLTYPPTVTYEGETFTVTQILGSRGLDELINLRIPSTVERITGFNSCNNLASVTIYGDGLTRLDDAFNHCASLTEFTVPSSVTIIKDEVLCNCQNLSHATFKAIRSSSDYRFFPGEHGGSIFSNCPNLTNITFGNEVEVIPNGAFINTGITSLIVPNTITKIGEYAFLECSSLASVAIGPSVDTIGVMAFGSCPQLSSIMVASSNQTFDSRDNCNAIIQTATNTLIRGWATSTVPNGVASIGSDAFYECTDLTDITFPNTLTAIDARAFYGCTGLTSISLPRNLKTIGMEAFYGCSGITSLTLSDSLTTIGTRAFYECESLTLSPLPPTLTTIGSEAFYSCRALDSLVIPAATTTIGNAAFSRSGLKYVHLPDNLTTISAECFSSCNLKTIVIGANTTEIGWNALESHIDTIFIYATTPPAAANAFGATSNSGTLITLCDARENYIFSTDWNAHFQPSQIECRNTYTIQTACNDSSRGVALVNAATSVTEFEGLPITLTAIANEGYHLLEWQDGNTQTTRTVTVSADTTYTAIFQGNSGIDNAASTAALNIYPNPTTSSATLHLSGIHGQCTIQIIDPTGRTLSSQTLLATGSNTAVLNVQTLASGMYYVRVNSAQTTNTQKLIVE